MINAITNANAYLNGTKLAGRLTEMELPAIKIKTQEITALGVYGVTEIPVGLEKMEAKLKFNSIYPDAWKHENPHKACDIIVKSNMIVTDPKGITSNVAVVANITGLFKELPVGTLKPGEMTESEHLMTVTYYKLQVGDEVVWEIDVYNNIYTHFGEDILKSFNDNQ